MGNENDIVGIMLLFWGIARFDGQDIAKYKRLIQLHQTFYGGLYFIYKNTPHVSSGYGVTNLKI